MKAGIQHLVQAEILAQGAEESTAQGRAVVARQTYGCGSFTGKIQPVGEKTLHVPSALFLWCIVHDMQLLSPGTEFLTQSSWGDYLYVRPPASYPGSNLHKTTYAQFE